MPVCPLCGVALQPTVTRFWHGVAFCDLCASGPPRHLRFVVELFYSSLLQRHLKTVVGLTFWTPASAGHLRAIDRYCFEADNQPPENDHIVLRPSDNQGPGPDLAPFLTGSGAAVFDRLDAWNRAIELRASGSAKRRHRPKPRD